MVKIKLGPLNVSWREPKRQPISVEHGPGWGKKEDTGQVSTSYQWTDRLPHPSNMANYDKWANDVESNIAFNVLTDIITGVGYHTEMPEEEEPDHKNKQVIDDYGETVNLDEDLQEITMAMLQKGFCPVERLGDYDLKILPPESFYIYRDKKGEILKYTQERATNDIIAEWKGAEMDDIILFFHRKTTSWPYGKSLTEPIGTLLDERQQMNEDMPKAIHRWAYPIPVMETSGSREALQKACEDRDVDDWIFVGNVQEGEVRWKTIDINPQARFIPYIELIYYQICEGLHAPLLLYLKNATEASATVMMESVDRLVNGIQRYLKRRVEKYLFEPQVGEPVPRLVWGQPKTGLEKVTLTDISSIINSPKVTFNQAQYIVKQFFSGLPEPEKEAQPQIPFMPFQKPKPEIPMEQMLEKLNDLQTGLNIIESNYVEHRITVINAMKLADRTITVYYKRVYPDGWKEKRNEEFERFTRRILQVPKRSEVYQVKVE